MQLEKEKDDDGNLMNGQPDGESEKGFFGRLMERAQEAQKEQR
jgi:YidC/Oxa1 family membrane protein insertase